MTMYIHLKTCNSYKFNIRDLIVGLSIFCDPLLLLIVVTVAIQIGTGRH